MTGLVDQFRHVGRQVAGEAHLVPCYGVDEPENRRVKRLTAEIQALEDLAQVRTGFPIKRISH